MKPAALKIVQYILSLAALSVLAGMAACAPLPRPRPDVEGAVKRLPKWERVRDSEKTSPSFPDAFEARLDPVKMKRWREIVELAKDAGLPVNLPGSTKEDEPGNNPRPVVAPAFSATPLYTELLSAVNVFFNSWPYTKDQDVWDIDDHWATPAEFMQYSGDCEDYAIAKYYALRCLGVRADLLRVAAVWDKRRRKGHAVLLAQAGNNTLTLDNLSDSIVNFDDIHHYIPVYYVNEQSMWTIASRKN